MCALSEIQTTSFQRRLVGDTCCGKAKPLLQRGRAIAHEPRNPAMVWRSGMNKERVAQMVRAFHDKHPSALRSDIREETQTEQPLFRRVDVMAEIPMPAHVGGGSFHFRPVGKVDRPPTPARELPFFANHMPPKHPPFARQLRYRTFSISIALLASHLYSQ
jgi:DNA-binding transcriptional LysR family regulator